MHGHKLQSFRGNVHISEESQKVKMWQAVNIGRRKFKKPISKPGMEIEYNFFFCGCHVARLRTYKNLLPVKFCPLFITMFYAANNR